MPTSFLVEHGPLVFFALLAAAAVAGLFWGLRVRQRELAGYALERSPKPVVSGLGQRDKDVLRAVKGNLAVGSSCTSRGERSSELVLISQSERIVVEGKVDVIFGSTEDGRTSPRISSLRSGDPVTAFGVLKRTAPSGDYREGGGLSFSGIGDDPVVFRFEGTPSMPGGAWSAQAFRKACLCAGMAALVITTVAHMALVQVSKVELPRNVTESLFAQVAAISPLHRTDLMKTLAYEAGRRSPMDQAVAMQSVELMRRGPGRKRAVDVAVKHGLLAEAERLASGVEERPRSLVCAKGEPDPDRGDLIDVDMHDMAMAGRIADLANLDERSEGGGMPLDPRAACVRSFARHRVEQAQPEDAAALQTQTDSIACSILRLGALGRSGTEPPHRDIGDPEVFEALVQLNAPGPAGGDGSMLLLALAVVHPERAAELATSSTLIPSPELLPTRPYRYSPIAHLAVKSLREHGDTTVHGRLLRGRVELRAAISELSVGDVSKAGDHLRESKAVLRPIVTALNAALANLESDDPEEVPGTRRAERDRLLAERQLVERTLGFAKSYEVLIQLYSSQWDAAAETALGTPELDEWVAQRTEPHLFESLWSIRMAIRDGHPERIMKELTPGVHIGDQGPLIAMAVAGHDVAPALATHIRYTRGEAACSTSGLMRHLSEARVMARLLGDREWLREIEARIAPLRERMEDPGAAFIMAALNTQLRGP